MSETRNGSSTGADSRKDSTDGVNIEEQLGKLPELPSDDEKDTKPVIKKEPEPYLNQADLEKLMEVIEHGTYSHCDIHKVERMERIIVCIPCQQLICALCLLDSHQSHDIRSVSSMKEYFKVKDTVENQVFELQQEHQKLKDQFKERKILCIDIENSSQKLVNEIDERFNVIRGILQVKQEQLISYVKQFQTQNVSLLSAELDKIRDLLATASNMITRAIAFFSKIDLKEADILPSEISGVVKKCQCKAVQNLQNKDKFLPERKFSKLLPSLDAVASICDTIHAEATKVIMTKTTKNSEHDVKKGSKGKPEKRKHSHSEHSSDKAFKKPKMSAPSTSSSLPQSDLNKRRSSTDKHENVDNNRKSCERSRSDSLSNNTNTKDSVQGSKVSHTRKSVDSALNQFDFVDSDGSESEKSESASATLPKLKLVEIKATNIEIGKCLLSKLSEEDGTDEKVLVGKVVDSSKMKDTTQYTVNWFKGEVGKDNLFEIKKKQSPVHSSSVICSFDFDHTKPMSQELKTELLTAKEYFSTKKTRKRKSSQGKEKVSSPKKDKDSSKTKQKSEK